MLRMKTRTTCGKREQRALQLNRCFFKRLNGNATRWYGDTHQNPAGGRLSRNQFARPVFSLGHERALELLLALPVGLLLLLLRIIWTEFRFLSTADEGARAPEQNHQQAGQERENTRQQEAPPFSPFKTLDLRSVLGRIDVERCVRDWYCVRHPLQKWKIAYCQNIYSASLWWTPCRSTQRYL